MKHRLSCLLLAVHAVAAQPEILLLVFSSAVDFVHLQILLMFKPEDFRLLLKTVDPE